MPDEQEPVEVEGDPGEVTQNDEPGAQLEAEPQEVRGAPGSRDTGSEGPGGGPADRPAGTAQEDDDTSVDPEGAEHPDAPHLQSGG